MFFRSSTTVNPALHAHQQARKLETIQIQYADQIQHLKQDERECIAEIRTLAQENDRETAKLKVQHLNKIRYSIRQYQKLTNHCMQMKMNQDFASANSQLMQQMSELATSDTSLDIINGLPDLYTNMEMMTKTTQQNTVASELMNDMMETMSAATTDVESADCVVDQIFDELQITWQSQLQMPTQSIRTLETNKDDKKV